MAKEKKTQAQTNMENYEKWHAKAVQDNNRYLAKQAQDNLTREYRANYSRIQTELGNATGNDARIAQLNAELSQLKQQYEADWNAAGNLDQYTSQFSVEEYNARKKKERQEMYKFFGANNPNSEQQGFLSSGIASSAATNSLANYLASKAPGGAPQEPNSAHLRRQAEMHDKQAADEQKNSQQNQQIANRDYRVEAEKNAASSAAAQNAQKVNNMGNVSAGAAALERGVEAADYNTHMQRQDQQRAEGVQNQREMWGARQTAEEERSYATKGDWDFTQAQVYNNAASSLSSGGVPDAESSAETTPDVQQAPVVNPDAPAPVAQQPEQVAEEPQQVEPLSVKMQSVLNWLSGATKNADVSGPNEQAYIKMRGLQPLPANANMHADPDLGPGRRGYVNTIVNNYPEFAKDYESVTGRHLGDDNQINMDSPEKLKNLHNTTALVEQQQPAQQAGVTPSDSSIKNILKALGGIRFVG